MTHKNPDLFDTNARSLFETSAPEAVDKLKASAGGGANYIRDSRLFLHNNVNQGSIAALQVATQASPLAHLEGIITDEFAGGCSLLVVTHQELRSPQKCWVQLESHTAPQKAELSWVKALEPNVYQLGLAYSSSAEAPSTSDKES